MLKVGVAGLRRGVCFIELARLLPELELYAVCSKNPERTRQIKKLYDVPHAFTDFDEFIGADFDLAVIATPLPLHAEHCIKALKNGKHTVSEVPACNSIEECWELLKTAKESSAKYFFGENMNYFPQVQSWKRMVDEGLIGRVFYAEVEYVHDCRGLMLEDGKPTWRVPMPPIQYCTHSIGPLLYILRDRVESISALHTGSKVSPELGAISLEVGIFRTEKGVVGKLLCAFSVEREPPIHWHCLYGTEGVLESKRCGWDKYKAYFSKTSNLQDMLSLPEPAHRGIPAVHGGHGSAEYLMMRDIVRALTEGTEPPMGIYEALDYTLPGLCAHQSAVAGGNPVEVPDPRKK